jgi:IS5 family transposase
MTKKRASTPIYTSPRQLTFCGFETPYEQNLNMSNRWVKLSSMIPWDRIVAQYHLLFKSAEGRVPINGRIVIGSVVIKHMLGLTDRETIQQIQENIYMQYFLGYSSLTNDPPFSPSLFVEIRERLSLEVLSGINDIITSNCFEKVLATDAPITETTSTVPASDVVTTVAPTPASESSTFTEVQGIVDNTVTTEVTSSNTTTSNQLLTKNHGKLLVDATVAPQNITFPTDIKLLNAAREKSEQLIDILYDKTLHGDDKLRTYREVARKDFLNAARIKAISGKQIYKAVGSQLRYLKRNLSHITILLTAYKTKDIKTPFKRRDIEYLDVLELVYYQQNKMHTERVNRVDDRIVNIHQPYVRPIKRGKDGKKVEFGSKMQVSLVNGFAFIDKLSWDNFNEGSCLVSTSIKRYKARFGFYPAEVLADQIYCTRENRKLLKALGIKLMAKPLGRPSLEALSNHVSPGERNPIEGKFGQAKVGYGLGNICAKLKTTSESWIASIMLVLNLVNLTRLNVMCIYYRFYLQLVCHFGSSEIAVSY